MGIKSTIKAGRNDPCPCGSELKFKQCHGDQEKAKACNAVANMYMSQLILAERKKRGLDPYIFICEKCGKGTDKPRPSELAKNILLCPYEACDGVVKVNEKPKQLQEKEQEKKSSIILEN